MNYRENVRNGELYLNLNQLLRKRLPELKTTFSQELQSFLRKKQTTKKLDVICKLEFHPWEQCTQWRIEIDFDEYQWSHETMKPHGVGAVIMLEEVAGKRTLHFSYRMYSTFDSKIKRREPEKMSELQLSDSNFVQSKLNEIALFLEKVTRSLMIEVEQIDFEQLELLEN